MVGFLALSLTACDKKEKVAENTIAEGSPTLREIETAMRDEYTRVFPGNVDLSKVVALQKLESCKKDDTVADGFVCIVQAEERMNMNKEGTAGALIEVDIRKADGKWMTSESGVPAEKADNQVSSEAKQATAEPVSKNVSVETK